MNFRIRLGATLVGDSRKPHQRRAANQVQRAIVDSIGHVAASISGPA